MVRATVQLKDGRILNTTAKDFDGLFEKLKGVEFVKIVGVTGTTKDLRQGKDDVLWQALQSLK